MSADDGDADVCICVVGVGVTRRRKAVGVISTCGLSAVTGSGRHIFVCSYTDVHICANKC